MLFNIEVKGGRMSYKWVHHGENPKPNRKAEPITASAVTSIQYKAIGG